MGIQRLLQTEMGNRFRNAGMAVLFLQITRHFHLNPTRQYIHEIAVRSCSGSENFTGSNLDLLFETDHGIAI